MTAIPLFHINPLNGAPSELLGVVDDGTQCVAIVGITRQRRGVQHELAAWGTAVGRHDRSFDAELQGRAGLALANEFALRSVEGVELPATLALLLRADLSGPCQRLLECRLELVSIDDLALDIADHPPKPAAQPPQFTAIAIELFGVDIASCHHCCALGML